MALEHDLFTIPGLKAEGDISTKQFYAVELSGAFQVDVCDAAADIAIGVLQNKPAAAGRAAEVRQLGLTKWVASAAISVGDRVGTTSTGKAVTKSSNNDWFIGIALEAAVSDGDVITVLLTGGGYFGA